MPEGWIVPEKDSSVLWVRPDATHYRHATTPLVKKAVVNMPQRAVHWLNLEHDRLVHAHKGHLYVHNGLSIDAPPVKIKIPGTPEIHAMHVMDDVLYTGAAGGKSMLGFLDLRQPRQWQVIPVSKEVNWLGKGIDGFARHKSRLIAIDDIVLPRYLLILDVTNPRDPQWIEHRDLPAHSSGERVCSVAANDEVVVLLSTTFNHGAAAAHIAFMSLETLEEYATLSVQAPMSFRKWSDRSYDFSSIAIIGNRLLIAAGADGVGILPIPPCPKEPLPKPKKNTFPFSRAEAMTIDAVKFVPVPSERVVEVVAVDEHQAFAVYEVAGNGFFKRNTFHSTLVTLPRVDSA